MTQIAFKTGICPVCNGTARVPAGDQQYKAILAGYDTTTDTLACNNCGGQSMACRGTGRVNLRPDGTKLGNCYWEYTCIHGCGDRYSIDSGD